MTSKDAILQNLGMAENVAKTYITDLSAADLLLRPVPGQNHIAWQLGHLLLTEHDMLDGVRPGSSPKLPEGFEEGHGREMTSVDDPSKYLPTEEYLKLMTAQREATKSVLNSLSDADLDSPGPDRFQRMAKTVGNLFVLVGSHQLMHVGQFVSVRRKLGKPVTM